MIWSRTPSPVRRKRRFHSGIQGALRPGSLPLLAASLLALAVPRQAAGHGGTLPLAQQILVRNGEMLVATPQWGLFIGREGGEWRWVCDEVISQSLSPVLALSSDGQTLYATDVTGLTISTDGGCSWNPATGTLAGFTVVGVVADPVQPGRAYALGTDFQTGTQTGLWKTEDRGKTWTLQVPIAGQQAAGLTISADGQKIGMITVTSTTPRSSTLTEAAPAGLPQSRVLLLSLDGHPLISAAPLRYEGTTLYLRSSTDAGHALHRLDGTTATVPTRLLTTKAPIYELARQPQTNTLLAATREGLYQQQPDQSFKLLPTLSGSWCLSVQGSTLYSCAWNFAPDQAAIAKLGPDLSTFVPAFRFGDTLGPIDCPANTPSARVCPAVWLGYSAQLKDTPEMPTQPIAPDLGTATAMSTGSCTIGARSRGPLGVGVLALFAAAVLIGRRRRTTAPADRTR
ncbi:MAG: hypothetical protein U1A78_26465 [Polyangia bacterium]